MIEVERYSEKKDERCESCGSKAEYRIRATKDNGETDTLKLCEACLIDVRSKIAKMF